MTHRIATGFDMEPMDNGNILIEFFSDDGKTANTQVVTRDALEKMPAVIALILACQDQGVEAVKRILESVRPAPQEEK